MATITPTLRPLSCWKSIIRRSRQCKSMTRSLSTYHQSIPAYKFDLASLKLPSTPHVNRKIKTLPPPPSPVKTFKEPLKSLDEDQIRVLDPTGARTNLFSKANGEAARVGDILLVRLKTGDPFAGVCINIRRRGVETGILLRNNLTRVGVEMWYKIYSPNVEGIEVVKRKEKRARRARLTYMRKEKHDMGSVQNIVSEYQRSRQNLRGSSSPTGAQGDVLKGGRRKVKGKR